MPALAKLHGVASRDADAPVRGRGRRRARAARPINPPRVLQPVRGGTVGTWREWSSWWPAGCQNQKLARRGAGVRFRNAAGHRRRASAPSSRVPAVLRGAAERVPERRRGSPRAGRGNRHACRVVGIEGRRRSNSPFAATHVVRPCTPPRAFPRPLGRADPRGVTFSFVRLAAAGAAAFPRFPGTGRARPGGVLRCRTRTPPVGLDRHGDLAPGSWAGGLLAGLTAPRRGMVVLAQALARPGRGPERPSPTGPSIAPSARPVGSSPEPA